MNKKLNKKNRKIGYKLYIIFYLMVKTVFLMHISSEKLRETKSKLNHITNKN